ncbi:MAG: DUF4351 domain-containing protein, partial [Chloroflexi bacterium]|nr:DUF4351 domain-containing protein [Chloroflexota bacterium]
LYTGEEPWRSKPGLELLMDLPEELRQFVPQFETLMLRLKQTDPDALTATGHPFGWLLTVMQKENASAEELEGAIHRAVDHLMELATDDRDAWTRLVHYMYLLLMHRRTPTEGTAIGGRISERLAKLGLKGEAEMAQTWAESLIEQGRHKGQQEGRLEGEIAAAQSLVIGLMTEKFGPLPEDVEIRIRGIHQGAELERLNRQILHAATIADLKL